MAQVHDGHRDRLRKRFTEEGAETFQEHEILELLLFYAIPRKNTNEIAHRLLERFGNLPQVLEATPADLQSVEGMGEHAAFFLSMFPAISRYYGLAKKKEKAIMKDPTDCALYLLDFFVGHAKENVYLLCLDATRNVLACPWVGEGNVNSASVPIRRVVEMALSVNATAVVLAHNHPSGISTPSIEDVATTKRLAIALEAVDVILADHVVVANGQYTSMVKAGRYRPVENVF